MIFTPLSNWPADLTTVVVATTIGFVIAIVELLVTRGCSLSVLWEIECFSCSVLTCVCKLLDVSGSSLCVYLVTGFSLYMCVILVLSFSRLVSVFGF